MSSEYGFEVLATGKFDAQHLIVEAVSTPRETNAELERLIDEAWSVRLREAQRKGRILFPGRLCRLVEFDVRSRCLYLRLGPTDFRELVGTNLSHPERFHLLGSDYFANALGVHAAVVSSDNQIIIYKRSALVAECPGAYDVCGGHVEPDSDCISGIPDPFGAIAREIHEEMAIDAAEIQSIICLGLVRNTATFKPDLIFTVHTSHSATSLLKVPLVDEHVEVSAIAADPISIERFLTRFRREMAPAGVASLTLLAQVLKS